ncbi:MAG: hypothetical protein AMXMBFR13_20140 [Phycisphaerae bacterium]
MLFAPMVGNRLRFCLSTGTFAAAFCAALLARGSSLSAAPSTAVFNVVDLGALGDGKTMNTEAIRKAIAACDGAGGGVVVIPPGRFLTGPIELRSNMELRLESGAVLEGSRNFDDYRGEGRRKHGLITARGARNVSVTGGGTILGNGTAFMQDRPKPLEHMNGQFTRQGTAYHNGRADGPFVMNDRPGFLVHFDGCSEVAVRDVTLRDAPEWTLVFTDCDIADARGVRILNNMLIPNNDGIHCVTSRNIHISDCDIQAGDDAIAVTGLWGRPGALCENITVSNCTLRSRSVAVRVGYGSNSIQRCVFQNLVVHDSNRGLGVFVRDEGSVTDILFSNIVIQTRLHTGWWGNGEPLHVSCIRQKKGTPLGRVEGVTFSNIRARSEHGIVVWANDDSRIRDLAFKDVDLQITPSPLNDDYGGNFDLSPATEERLWVFKHDIPALYARGVDGLRIDGFRVNWAEDLPDFFTHAIECEHFDNLLIDGFEGRQSHPDGRHAAIALRDGRKPTVRHCHAAPDTGIFLSHHSLKDTGLWLGNDLRAAGQVADPAPLPFAEFGGIAPSEEALGSRPTK